MKLVIVLFSLFISLNGYSQIDSWTTTIKVQQESASEVSFHQNTFRILAIGIMIFCSVLFGLNKAKSSYYEKKNKDGSGSVQTMDQMWSANKKCVAYAFFSVVGLILWYMGDGPVPIIQFFKPFILKFS